MQNPAGKPRLRKIEVDPVGAFRSPALRGWRPGRAVSVQAEHSEAWIIERMFAASGIAQGGSTPLILMSVVLISLTSHIYMTSHAARTAALIPPLLFLAQKLELNLAAMMFIGPVGIDYCLTFPVSSKALLMFQELDRETWVPADLLKLSAVLLPVHAALMVAFYYGWWRHVGLDL